MTRIEDTKDPLLPGITPRSLAAIVLTMLVTAILVQVSEILIGLTHPAEHTLAIPAVMTFLVLVLAAGGLELLARRRILTRPERLCVLFALLIGTPLMTQGFWHRIVAISSTIPRMGDFEKIDALSDRLWPHGPNLLAGMMERGGAGTPGKDAPDLKITGNVKWQQVRMDLDPCAATSSQPHTQPGDGSVATATRPPRAQADDEPPAWVAVLRNAKPSDVSAVRVRLPKAAPGTAGLVPGEQYLASVLARARNLGPEANYYFRIHRDEETQYQEAFRSNAGAKLTFLHKGGFVRVGAYGVRFPTGVREATVVEFGLSGVGDLELADPKLLSVAALAGAYGGKQEISRSDFQKLPEDQRTGLLVRPDNMWSWEGVKYLAAGYIPLADWAEPVLTWTGFVALVLMATLAVNVIMRRQWIESERYQMPIAQVPLALLGPPGEPDQAVPSIWRSRVMWAGFAVAMAWCLMRGWNFYNPNVPDVGIRVVLKDYFSGPAWGKTFENVFFEVSAVFVALAVFMELNILASLLVGFAMYHSQHWFGEMTGLSAHSQYPFANQQQVAAFFAYAMLVLLFSRKHLWRVLVEAVRGRPPAEASAATADAAAPPLGPDGVPALPGAPRADPAGPREMWSYRTALLVLVGTFVGIVLWGQWVGVPAKGMLIFFAFVLCISLVCAKARAECGTPFGYFACWNATMFLVMLGGMTVFGPRMMLTGLVASFFLCETVFFLIPGAQFELIELGRRYRVVPRHLMYTAVLGLVGGMVFGGWVFLSNSYSLGGESLRRYAWAYYEKSWYFFDFNTNLEAATTAMLAKNAAAAAPAVAGGIPPETWAYAYGAGITTLLTVLRQIFAGFWFHPLGFILGTTRIMDYIWGSVLVALVIRSSVLWFGGAATVREKLRPFFIGVFLGSITTFTIWGMYGLYLLGHDVERIYGAIP
jgi:hypothetical protein